MAINSKARSNSSKNASGTAGRLRVHHQAASDISRAALRVTWIGSGRFNAGDATRRALHHRRRSRPGLPHRWLRATRLPSPGTLRTVRCPRARARSLSRPRRRRDHQRRPFHPPLFRRQLSRGNRTTSRDTRRITPTDDLCRFASPAGSFDIRHDSMEASRASSPRAPA